MSDSPSRPAPPTTYVLTPCGVGDADSLDLIGAVALLWRHRLAFGLAFGLCLIASMSWALSAAPPIKASVILRPALMASRSGGHEPLIATSTSIVECEEIVFPELRRQLDPETQSPMFKGIELDAKAGDIFLIVEATAPRDAFDRTSLLLDQASSRIQEFQSKELDSYRQVLDGQIERLAQSLADLRSILATRVDQSDPSDPSVIAMEIGRLEAQLSDATFKRLRSTPAAEVRGVRRTTDGGESSWRIKRVLAAIGGSTFVGFATAAGCIVISGVRRRLNA